MSRLSSEQRSALDRELRASYTGFYDLARLLKHSLGRSLKNIANESGMDEVVYKVIEDAEAKGWVSELVVAAAKDRPSNDDLAALAAELGGVVAAPLPLPPPSPPQPQPAPPAAPAAPAPAPDPPAPVTVDPDGRDLPAALAVYARDYVKQIREPDSNRRTLVLERIVDGVRRRAPDSPPPDLVSYLMSADPGVRVVGIALVRACPTDPGAWALLQLARQPLSLFEEHQAINALGAVAGCLSGNVCVAISSLLLERIGARDVPDRTKALLTASLAKVDDRLVQLGGEQ